MDRAWVRWLPFTPGSGCLQASGAVSHDIQTRASSARVGKAGVESHAWMSDVERSRTGRGPSSTLARLLTRASIRKEQSRVELGSDGRGRQQSAGHGTDHAERGDINACHIQSLDRRSGAKSGAGESLGCCRKSVDGSLACPRVVHGRDRCRQLVVDQLAHDLGNTSAELGEQSVFDVPFERRIVIVTLPRSLNPVSEEVPVQERDAFTLVTKLLLRLPWRSVEGFLGSLLNLVEIDEQRFAEATDSTQRPIQLKACGCATGGPAPWWGLMFVPLLGLRRRA